MRRAILIAAGALVVAGGVAAWLALRGPAYDPVLAPTPLGGWSPPWREAPRPDPEERLPSRWIVVGWDGAGWDLALPLIDAGKMPHLAGLMREGAYGTMASFKPTWSPVLWTTVATGVDPSRHGILAWGRVEKGTTRRLFTNRDRRARALWNLMTAAGRKSLVVGYHNTFPADRIEGLMVSSFLYHEHLEDRMEIRDGAEPPGEGLAYPPGGLQEILGLQREVVSSLPAAVGRFAAYAPEEAIEFEAPLTRTLGTGDERRFFLKKAYLFDTMTGRVAERFYPELRPDLAMIHFQGIDFASHYFLYFHDPPRFDGMAWPAEERAALDAATRHYAGTVEAFYLYADEWLGRILALRPPDTGVLLLSDHGFEPEDNVRRTGNHLSAPPGIFVVAAPGVRPGRVFESATLYDVMPTLAAVLGLPLARDLRGTPQAAWFTREAWAALKIERVARYDPGGRYVPDIPVPDETERELLEQLRAIGYVQ